VVKCQIENLVKESQLGQRCKQNKNVSQLNLHKLKLIGLIKNNTDICLALKSGTCGWLCYLGWPNTSGDWRSFHTHEIMTSAGWHFEATRGHLWEPPSAQCSQTIMLANQHVQMTERSRNFPRSAIKLYYTTILIKFMCCINPQLWIKETLKRNWNIGKAFKWTIFCYYFFCFGECGKAKHPLLQPNVALLFGGADDGNARKHAINIKHLPKFHFVP
jgi:hypothetical protein